MCYLYLFCLHCCLINIHIFDYPDSRLSGLFSEVPTSPDNRGSTVLLPCVTNDLEKRQRETQATDLPLLQNRSENFVRFVLLVSGSVFVYGTSLTILVKYFGADLQRRNDKFERTILDNLRLAVLDLGSWDFQC